MIKWIGVGLGTILGISHIGMIGYIATVNKEQGLPKLDIPVTPYTSYVVQANKDGYKLSYTANDPKTAFITKDIKEKAGFLGLANILLRSQKSTSWMVRLIKVGQYLIIDLG